MDPAAEAASPARLAPAVATHPRLVPVTNRARRFSLPDMDDERVDEAITSFIAGPLQGRGRRGPVPVPSAPVDPFAGLHTRIAWTEALHRETARSIRYRRPASVVVIVAEATAETPDAAAWLERVAGPIAHSVHRGIRQTDLATRTGNARFQVLLPETTDVEATHLAARIVLDCQVWLQALGAPVRVRAA